MISIRTVALGALLEFALLGMAQAQPTVVPGPPLPIPPVTAPVALTLRMSGAYDANDKRVAVLDCHVDESAAAHRIDHCTVRKAAPAEFGAVAIKRAEEMPAVPPNMPDGRKLGPNLTVTVLGTGLGRPAGRTPAP